MRTAAILPVKRFESAKQRLSDAVGGPDRRELAAAMVGDVLAALGEVEGLDDVIVVTAEERAAELARAAGAHVVPDRVEAGQSAAAEAGIAAASERGAERALLVPGDCPALDPAEVNSLLAYGVVPDASGSGVTPPEVTRSGVTPPEVTRLGVTSPEVTGSGVTPPEVTRLGVTPPEVTGSGVTPPEVTGSVVIVADRHGTGTNALLLEPPDAMAPAFGPGSFARHAARARAAGATVRVAQAPSLGLDVDTPGDLEALRAALAGRPGVAPRTRALLERLAPAAAR